MKYVKTYQKYMDNQRLRDDYYVICHDNERNFLNDFFDNNIGQLIERDKHLQCGYCIEYENIPSNLMPYFFLNSIWLSRNDIKHFSKNKEDLELIIKSKAYNL